MCRRLAILIDSIRLLTTTEDDVRLAAAADETLEHLAAKSSSAGALADLPAQGRRDPVRQARKGKTLQVYLARPRQVGQEQPLAAEQSVRKAADELDVVRDSGPETYDTPRVHSQRLTGHQVFFNDGAPSVHEGHPITLQALQDEALTAEEAGTDLLREGDFDFDA